MNVKTLCLGILYLGDATGYEIRKMTEEGRFSHFVDASFGAIYPALASLEADGLVSCREEQQAGRPGRKIYSLTDSGHAALSRSLAVEPRNDIIKSELLFLLRFAELVSPEHISAQIDRRLGWLEERIAELEEAAQKKTDASGRFACGYGLAVYRAMRGYLADHRHEIEAAAGLRPAAE